jgi:hypothetical protein
MNNAQSQVMTAASNVSYSQSSMSANTSALTRAEARVVILEMIRSGELMQLMTEDSRFYQAMVRSAGNTE